MADQCKLINVHMLPLTFTICQGPESEHHSKSITYLSYSFRSYHQLQISISLYKQ